MNEQLATFFERLAGKAPAWSFLQRMGLDPAQFVLYLGLFRTLSERGEFAGGIGVSRFSVAYLALYSAAIGVIPWLGLAAFLPARIFLIADLSIVFVFTFLMIIREGSLLGIVGSGGRIAASGYAAFSDPILELGRSRTFHRIQPHSRVAVSGN